MAYHKQKLWGGIPDADANPALFSPKNANRYALCAVPMQLKIGKDRECKVVPMLRSRTGRSTCRKMGGGVGGKSIPKPRRYAIKNQVLGINHQKDPSKMLKTPRNSNRFSESKSESETKHQPLCWREKKCHQKHQSLCWKEKSDTQNASRYAEEERGAIQNAGRYAEEERIAIQNTGRYAENEEQKGRIRIA